MAFYCPFLNIESDVHHFKLSDKQKHVRGEIKLNLNLQKTWLKD